VTDVFPGPGNVSAVEKSAGNDYNNFSRSISGITSLKTNISGTTSLETNFSNDRRSDSSSTTSVSQVSTWNPFNFHKVKVCMLILCLLVMHTSAGYLHQGVVQNMH